MLLKVAERGYDADVIVATKKDGTAFARDDLREYINTQLQKKNLVRIKRKGAASIERTGAFPADYSGNASNRKNTTPSNKSQPQNSDSMKSVKVALEEDTVER